MSVKLKFKCVCLKRNIVLLWSFWISFPFIFIKACSHDATCIIGFFGTIMLKPKKWFMNERMSKELCTNQIKTLSAFSLSPHIQVLQTLTQSFLSSFSELWMSFQLSWIKELFREFNVLILMKDWLFSEDFYQRFDWQNQVMLSMWQTGVANTKLEFSGEAWFQIFSQK